MTMDQAAIFLASSILAGLASIIIIGVILVINNLLHKYWKSLNLYRIVDPNARFAESHELEKIDKDKK